MEAFYIQTEKGQLGAYCHACAQIIAHTRGLTDDDIYICWEGDVCEQCGAQINEYDPDEYIARGVCPSCTWRGDVHLENGVCPQCGTDWRPDFPPNTGVQPDAADGAADA